MSSEEQKLVRALELLDSEYHTKERELYLYLCDKYNVNSAEPTNEHPTNRTSLSWFSGPDSMIFVDDQRHSRMSLSEYEGAISPMDCRIGPQSVERVYKDRIVAFYRRQYPELETFDLEEMDQILESRKLRKGALR